MSEVKKIKPQKAEQGTVKRNIPLTVIGVLLCLVFGFMLVCNLIITIKGSISPETPPSVFGVTPMVVLTGSMSGDAEDHIEAGDLIFSKGVDTKELKVGDVISYMEGSIVVTHRIIGIETAEDGSLQFLTKGDANNTEDTNPVKEKNVIGIYFARIPKMGEFAIFLQSPVGMLIFIGIPVLAFVIIDIVRRTRASSEETKRSADMEAELERLRALAGEKAAVSPAEEAPLTASGEKTEAETTAE